MIRQSFGVCFAVILSFTYGFQNNKKCTCVPDQWHGILSSVDKEFDFLQRQAGHSSTQMEIHYDFKKKRFAMTDLLTGNKAVANYAKGVKYIIHGSYCRAIPTVDKMKQMCIPDHAEYEGQHLAGVDIPVDLWKFTAPWNVTMRTVVRKDNCVPLSEELYMEREGDYATLTSSLYLDVKLGMEDPSVFQAPLKCLKELHKSRMNRVSDGMNDKRNDAEEEKKELNENDAFNWALPELTRELIMIDDSP